MLRSFGLDASDSQIDNLTPTDKAKLVGLGLLADQDFFPLWTTYMTYHWNQEFPAHKTVHICHEYPPSYGYEPVEVEKLQTDLKDACIEDRLENGLRARVEQRPESPKLNFGEYVYAEWVDYILTAANTWKTPIKPLELVVGRPKQDEPRNFFVSFCWEREGRELGRRSFYGARHQIRPGSRTENLFFAFELNAIRLRLLSLLPPLRLSSIRLCHPTRSRQSPSSARARWAAASRTFLRARGFA